MKFHEIFFREKCPLVWSAAMKQTWFLVFFPGVECCEWFSGTSLAAGHVTSPQHSFIQICFSFFFCYAVPLLMLFTSLCLAHWVTGSPFCVLDKKYLLCYSHLTRVLINRRQFKVSGRGFVESGKLWYHSIALLMLYQKSFGLDSIKPSVRLDIGSNDKFGKRWRARYSSSFWNY